MVVSLDSSGRTSGLSLALHLLCFPWLRWRQWLQLQVASTTGSLNLHLPHNRGCLVTLLDGCLLSHGKLAQLPGHI